MVQTVDPTKAAFEGLFQFEGATRRLSQCRVRLPRGQGSGPLHARPLAPWNPREAPRSAAEGPTPHPRKRRLKAPCSSMKRTAAFRRLEFTASSNAESLQREAADRCLSLEPPSTAAHLHRTPFGPRDPAA